MAALLTSEKYCAPCAKSELNYNDLPPIQRVIEDTYTTSLGPVSTLDQTSPLVFHISGSDTDYLDLSNTVLNLKCKVTDAAGAGISDTNYPKTSLVNNVLNSLFSQVDISMNETLVSQSTNLHPYRAYIETLLSYDNQAKNSFLQLQGWATDEAGVFDNDENDGHTTRRSWISGGKELSLRGKIHSDVHFLNHLIPNGIDVRITLTPAKPSFVINSFESTAADFKIEITRAALEVCKVKISDAEQLRIEKLLAKDNLYLPVTHATIKSFAIPAGVQVYDIQSLYQGQLPSKVICGLVKDTAVNGAYAENPFSFKNQNIGYISLYVGGKQIPSQAFTPRFDKKDCARSYASLFEALGTDGGHDLTLDEYINDNCLFCFDLSPDKSSGSFHTSGRKSGNIRASIQFREQIANTVSLIVYAQFDNTLSINRFRSIGFDFAI